MARGNPPVRAGSAEQRSPDAQRRDSAGGSVAGTLDPAVNQSEQTDGSVYSIDSRYWSDSELAAALDRLLTSGIVLDERVVVAFAATQVDIVASALLDTDAQLLSEPTPLALAGALVLAEAVARPRVGEPPRPEAARLAAIAEEVARIAETLNELAARDPAARSALADRRMTFDDGRSAGATAPVAAPPVTAAQVRGAIRSRRTRDAIFGAGWFEEPAWDMLLDLLAAELEGARVSVSSLCIAAAVAQTTALRWISKMILAGPLEREDDATDRRRAFVTLSERAGANMRSYFAAVQRLGLGIA